MLVGIKPLSGAEKTANLRWFGHDAFNKLCKAVNK
jgi:hypothetical protein